MAPVAQASSRGTGRCCSPGPLKLGAALTVKLEGDASCKTGGLLPVLFLAGGGGSFQINCPTKGGLSCPWPLGRRASGSALLWKARAVITGSQA